jgi:ABC transport system ATP-binding/permease protein
LQRAQAAVADPAIISDAAGLETALDELANAQNAMDALYARWAELEAKLS